MLRAILAILAVSILLNMPSIEEPLDDAVDNFSDYLNETLGINNEMKYYF